MSVKFTAEQQLAIDSRKSRILVSAGAGSGKTTVMAERILKFVREGESVLRMLIITFTRMSAADLRSKLFEKFSKCPSAGARAALGDLDTADISTIHAWAAEFIRAYFHHIDDTRVSPAFAIMDEMDSDYYLGLATDRVFDSFVKKDDIGFATLADVYSKGRTDKALKEHVFDIYKFAYSTPDPDGWLNGGALIGYAEPFRVIEIVEDYCAEKKDYLEHSGLLLRVEARRVDDRLATICDTLIACCRAEICPDKLVKPKNLSDEADALYKKIYDYGKLLRKELAAIAVCRAEPSGESLPYAQKLVEVARAVAKEYSALKAADNVLDYSDLEQITFRLLDDPNVLSAAREHYKYVFVDEYQDVNGIQNAIIERLNPHNLFVVGDIKQSIYAFRLCDPDIFLAKMHDWKSDPEAEVIGLNANFRSTAEILKFNNAVFGKIMTEKFGGVDYASDAAFVVDENTRHGAEVSVCKIDMPRSGAKPPASGVYDPSEHCNADALSAAEAEADIVYACIARALEEPEISFGEIAVLVRSRNDYAQRIFARLQKHGVPIVFKEKRNISESFVGRAVINLFCTLLNMRDDYALAGVLRSPFFAVSDDDLLAARKAFDDFERVKNVPKSAVQPFCVAALYYSGSNSDPSALRLRDAIKRLKEYSEMARYTKADILLDFIASETGFCDRLALMSGSKTFMSDFAALIGILRDAKFASGLVRTVEYLKNVPCGIESAEPDFGSAVRMLTVHSVKGLEFPVVIYAGTGCRFNNTDDKREIQLSRKLGLGLSAFDPLQRISHETPVKFAITVDNARRRKAEEMRLTYVAMTRAQQLLFVTGRKPAKDFDPHPFAVGAAACPMTWIDAARTCGYKFLETEPALDSGEAAYVADDVAILAGNAPKQLVCALQNSLNFCYGYNILQPLKTTATALNESTDAEAYYGHVLTDDDYVRGNGGAETGTAYHAVMQHIDIFAINGSNAREMIDGLAHCGKITRNQAVVVDAEKILKCIRSGIFDARGEYFREKEFLFGLPGNLIDPSYSPSQVVVQGVIDLLIVDGLSVTIVDYKTNRLSESALRELYARQLNIYELAVKRIIKNAKVQKIIYSFYLDKIIAL